MNDLTKSTVDRQNVLNNKYAVEKLQEYLGLTGMLFNDEYKFTIQQVIDFYMVDRGTVIRYLNQFENELKHNGYEVLKGKKLKEFKIQFGHMLEEGSKAPQLGVFNFRALLNLGMLLSESEKAKALRSKMLDIVIDTINNKLGGSTKYINQRDEDFFTAILKEPHYRKKFTSALNRYVDMDNSKYSFFTDRIYKSIFNENAKEYKHILQLEDTENPRDTMYGEVLKMIASFENGLAHEMEVRSKNIARKLTQLETEELIETFSKHPLFQPLIEDACIKMASRDYGFRQVLHERLREYLNSVPLSDFDRFLGEKSKTLEERLEENKDVFIRLKTDKMAFLYFTTEYAIKTHDKIIEISGGASGIKDLGNLQSPLEHIQNDDYYPDFEDKITHLVFSINKNHAFTDGNKRSSIALGAFFLELNGLDNMVSKFIIEMENIAVHVADNRIDKDLLFEIIKSLIYEEDYSEELKLKIIESIT